MLILLLNLFTTSPRLPTWPHYMLFGNGTCMTRLSEPALHQKLLPGGITTTRSLELILVTPTIRQPTYTCWTCNRPGHISSHCPSLRHTASASNLPLATQNHNTIPQPGRTPNHSTPSFNTMPPFRAPQRENLLPQRSANIHVPANRPRTCMYWNQDRSCTNTNCRFLHKCSKCQQSDHGLPHCPNR